MKRLSTLPFICFMIQITICQLILFFAINDAEECNSQLQYPLKWQQQMKADYDIASKNIQRSTARVKLTYCDQRS